MSMAALINTVTNRSKRLNILDVVSAHVVDGPDVYAATVDLYLPLDAEAAFLENAATLYAASAALYQPILATSAFFQNAPTLYAATVALIEPPGAEQQATSAFLQNAVTVYAADEVEQYYPPAASYSNYMGTGDRRRGDMTLDATDTGVPRAILNMIDGQTVDFNYYFANGAAAREVVFKFLYPVIITEAKWYQGNADAHGVWRWQGSNNNGSSWADIGATFTLGGSTTQTITTLAFNSTAYSNYRLLKVSGSSSSSPFLYEVEFKILGPDPITVSFDEGAAFSKGNRTSTISITETGFASLFGGGMSVLVNGAEANDIYADGGAGEANLNFDFGSPVILKGAHIIRSGFDASGVWRFRGSSDGTTWTTISDNDVLMNKVITTLLARGNNTAYRYYQIYKVSGAASGSPYWQEIYFAQDTGGGGGGGGDYTEAAAAYLTGSAPTFFSPDVELFDGGEPEFLELVAALVTDAPTVYAATADLVLNDPLWANVVFVLDTLDHSAAAEGQRLRHHSADSEIGQSIPVSNAYYTTAQKLAGRDYSIGGGAANDLTTIFGLDLNAGAFTIEARVRRSQTGQSLLMHQGPGSSVFRFGFEAGNNARLWFSYTTNGVTWINLYSLSAAVSATHAWKHIAADRGADNVLRLFLEGVMVAKSTLSFVIATPIDTKLNVGASLTSGGSMFMDDVRVTVGVNRYGADASFTPPGSLLRGPSPDEHWSNVVALQRFDARVGATIAAFADASPAALYVDGAAGVTVVTGTPHTPTAINSVGGGYVRSKAGAAGSNLSGGALWTIEARARLANVGDVSGVACAQETAFATTPNSTDKQWRLGFSSDAKPYFEAQLVGGLTFTLASVTALTKDVWFDLAADCDGSIVRLYVDGDMAAKGTMSADIIDNTPATKCFYSFGGAGTGGAGFPGSLDEVRVTRNVARYDSDAGYTPLGGRFPAY